MYDELVAHYTKSTKASLDLMQLMQYLTSLWIGDGTWRGTSVSFILNFQDKVREFEKMVADKNNHFSDGWKMILLQNAIHPLAELRQVKLTADQNKVSSGTDLTFDAYFQLVYNAAINYDAQFQYKKGPHRAVFAHDLIEYNDQGTTMYEDGYDIDTTPDVVLAHIAS
jgi:hypothetical protein